MNTKSDLIAAWRKAQGHDFPDRMDEEVKLGPYLSDRWLRDPKTVLFTLARYKFVAQMLKGCEDIAEVGAGDGWASKIVSPHVTCFDLSPLSKMVHQHDIMAAPVFDGGWYDAIYCLDVFEHVPDSKLFFSNLALSLSLHGKLVIGTPSLESQQYASEPSRKLHINCVTGEILRRIARDHFRHVFLFSQNDEVVHTGFLPMSHYLWAVCAEPIR